MKKTTIILLFGLFSFLANAQTDTTYWTNGGDLAINFTQVSFTNWSAGGQNSVAGVSKLNYSANYKKANIAWDNAINLGFGLSKVENIAVQKNEDIIDFSSKFGAKASEKWFYTTSLTFLSQFGPGYSDETNTTITSNFLAPANLNLAIGMDYKPSEKFNLLLAPLTGKSTFVMDEQIDETLYGLQEGQNLRMELGASVKALVKASIMKNVGLTTEVGLFSNYLNNPQNIDVDWKLSVKMKINEYLSASIDTRLLYDADMLDPVDKVAKVQFKELLGIGLSFKL